MKASFWRRQLTLTAPIVFLLLIAGTNTHASPTQRPLISEYDSAITLTSPTHSISSDSDGVPEYSNRILAALHGLGRSWSQAYAPNGMALVPATVPVGTLLHHVGPYPDAPANGMEWLAFDAEHSFIFTRMTFGGPGSAFYTFTPTRPLRLLALDGFSATFSGSQDLQDVLAYRHAPDGVNREFERSQVLCDWALPRGIDGFIREEAAFEVIYCDFARGIKLLDRVRTSFNSTPPEVDGEYVGHDESERWGMGRRRYDRMREVAAPGQEMQTTVYRNQSRWSMYHAASWHHRTPDTRFKLHPEYLVSLYDPSYTSLAEAFCKPLRDHRLFDISLSDVDTFIDEVENVVQRWKENTPSGGSGVDWSAVAQAVVDRNADRLAELRHALRLYTSASSSPSSPPHPPSSTISTDLGVNTTAALSHIRLITFALVMPYVDAPSALSPSSTSASRRNTSILALEKCTQAFTAHIPFSLRGTNAQLSVQETRLKRAIEGVLRRICSFSLDVLVGALDALDATAGSTRVGTNEVDDGTPRAMEMMRGWLGGLGELMQWLSWPVWIRCERQCGWDEQCFIPMFPVGLWDAGGESEEEQLRRPRCVKFGELGPTRMPWM